MAEPTIICPKCKSEIKLTESLAAPLIESTRHDFEQRLAQKDLDVAGREKSILEREEALSNAKNSLETQVTERVQQERGKIAADEARKARLALTNDLNLKAKEVADLQEILKQKDEKLTEAQKVQAELLKKERELDDARRELDLTVQKRVSEGLAVTRQQARKEAEDELRLKVSEKEQTIASMSKQIEDLKRRAEQGSQQLQGEVQELELETLLKARFPHDVIEPVAKGEHGGDVLQRVVSPLGQSGGTILWESKRTKNWSDTWLAKLRDDQRTAKAEIAVIISQVLPKGVETFGLVEGVWVATPQAALPVAVTMRYTLMEIASARQASEGQQTKMELVYQYLNGPRFKHRVGAIVERFSDMQEDLDKERKNTMRMWAKREGQIRGVIEATAGMYGDLQGIAGKSFQE
ncbi:MAG: DUF2130 domain-containing protein, partial [Opitutaceae bacterium]|nr:DUF2130 domain-containing protein [Verrucomicrobiales bacterium]